MKSFVISLITLIVGLSVYGQELKQLPLKRIDKYDKMQQGTLALETNFGSPVILNKSDIKKLKGKKIYHVDLVYTKYRETPDFDQNQLNLNRMKQLESIVPEIKEQKPNWTVYEQTGATERADAKTYYHGFVVHYGDDIGYREQRKKSNNLRVPFAKVGIDNQVGGYARYYTGSTIEMKPKAVYHKNGDLVKGYYQLYYREFRNQADIATSGIPMFYNEHGNHGEIFNSTGMYEIRAYKDGEELILKKEAIINFKSTAVINDVNFYVLDEDGHWTQEGIIEESNTSSKSSNSAQGNILNSGSSFTRYEVVSGMVGSKIKFQKYIPQDEIDQGAYQGQTRVKIIKAKDYNQIIVTFQGWEQLRWYRKGRAGRDSRIREITSDLDTQGVVKTVLVDAEDSVEFIEYMCGAPFEQLKRTKEDCKSVGMQDFTVYATENYGRKVDSQLVAINSSYIPPTAGLINGLRSRTFGVYNCDQTRRLNKPVALNPIYYDKESNEKLENLYQTCVIDLNINASLSYPPNHIYCSSKGNTKILIITGDKELYYADQSTVNGTIEQKEEMVDIQVQNVTDKVKDVNDLRELLGVY